MSTELSPGTAAKEVSRRRGVSGATPLRERVYEALRDELMSGQISPFERLAEERIAERFETSRTPVREAVARLFADGRLEKRNGGLYLYLPNFEELTGLYELRITLELRGIQRAIEEPSVRHDRARLETELARWYAHRDGGTVPDPGFVAEDERFHTELLDASGNPSLTRALVQVNQRIRSVRMYDYLTDSRLEATIRDHLEIGELVLQGRLSSALDALRNHVGASREVVLERAAKALSLTAMLDRQRDR